MDTTAIDRWLAGYVEAWRSDDAGQIEALFSEDSSYLTAPYRPPLTRGQLVAYWVAENESRLPWSFDYEVLAREGALYVVRAVTRYPRGENGTGDPAVYHNLWLITLAADGRASRFVEYFMTEEPGEQA